MKNAAYALLAIVIATLTPSCNEEYGNDLNNFLGSGGFVRFQDDTPPTVVGVNEISEIQYTFTLEDPNGNVALYDLKLQASLNGVRTQTVPLAQATTFPTTFSFSADDLANALGITTEDINFGGSFFFTAEVTTTEGIVYSASELLGIQKISLQADGTFLNEEGNPVSPGPNDKTYIDANSRIFLISQQDKEEIFLQEDGTFLDKEGDPVILGPNEEICTNASNQIFLVPKQNTEEILLQKNGTFLDKEGDPVILGPNEEVCINLDGKIFLVSGQNTTGDLIDEPGYRQAFAFEFIILCPSADLSRLAGVYTVLNHTFDEFFGPQGDTRTVIAGPKDDQITILGGALPLDGADDLILNINTTSSQVSYGGPKNSVHFNTFGTRTYGSVQGLVFTCTENEKIDIQINSEGAIPNFLTLEKQVSE